MLSLYATNNENYSNTYFVIKPFGCKVKHSVVQCSAMPHNVALSVYPSLKIELIIIETSTFV